MREFRTALTEAARQFGVALSELQVEQCTAYAELLLQWNERINLTRIVEPREMAVKHFVDSAAPLKFGLLSGAQRIIDVGTGAGFPGLVLKIISPNLHVVLLDSVGKRLGFLDAVIARLGLEGVETLHARAEDAGRQEELREHFDVAVAREVAELSVLSEYLLPFVRVGGKMIALKGPDVSAEVAAAARAVTVLGGGEAESISFELPENAGGRTLVWYEKRGVTPRRYPRKAGEPSRRPLG